MTDAFRYSSTVMLVPPLHLPRNQNPQALANGAKLIVLCLLSAFVIFVLSVIAPVARDCTTMCTTLALVQLFLQLATSIGIAEVFVLCPATLVALNAVCMN